MIAVKRVIFFLALGSRAADAAVAAGVHDAEIDCGRYSADGKWAVSGSKDRTDKFWDPRTFELIHIIQGNPGRAECMCFSADGKTLATGFALDKMSHITLWDLSEWNK